MERPDIFDYSDYKLYLAAWFEFKKQDCAQRGVAAYSHRRFARDAGLANVGTLVSVIKGERHLTDALVQAFLLPLELKPDDEEAIYLSLLARCEERRKGVEKLRGEAAARGARAAGRPSTRELLAQQKLEAAEAALSEIEGALVGSRRMHRALLLSAARLKLMSEWYVSAILELSKCAGFKADPAWVSAALRGTVTPEQAREALDLLRADGQLGGLSASSAMPVVTADAVNAQMVMRTYEGYFERSVEAFRLASTSRAHQELCRLGALMIAVPSTEIERLRTRALELRKDLFQFMEGLQGEHDTVYLAMVHVFPISERTSAVPDPVSPDEQPTEGADAEPDAEPDRGPDPKK